MIEAKTHLQTLARDRESPEDRRGFVRLDRNERVTPFSEAEFKNLIGALTPDAICSYPDPSPLYRRLAAELKVPETSIQLTNGSDAAIRKIFQAYVRPGDVVVYPDPTYAMYAIYCRMFEAAPAVVEYRLDRRLDIDVVLEQVQRRPRLLAIANP